MSVKKDDTFQLRLQYDYNKKPVNGLPISISILDDAITAFHILLLKRKTNTALIKGLGLKPLVESNPDEL